jgi:hypothetical protein
MPNTTPVYGWPWPLGTDRVMDGDDAMGALANAIENTVKALIPAGGLVTMKASVPAATPPSSYPLGLSIMGAQDWEGAGLYSLIITFRYGQNFTAQMTFSVGNRTPNIAMRTANNDAAWFGWTRNLMIV